MATTLDVVNDCLATLGEAPLNSLSEPHVYRGRIQRLLTRVNRTVQVEDGGWWFNTEGYTLAPNPSGQIQLPGDVLKWQSGVRSTDTLVRSQPKPWLVQRGTRLYDTRTHSYIITESVTGEVVREVPFDDLPTVVNDYVAAQTVLQFQSDIDADNSRRAELSQNWQLARIAARSENIRQKAVNLRNNNATLSTIKSVVRQARHR